MKLDVAARTDRGRNRPHNEDALVVRELSDGYSLIAVADGMGGAAGGATASASAARTLEEVFAGRQVGDPREALASAVAEANRRIYEEALAQPELHGMGTTLVAALLHENRAWLANVGDSRAYLIRGARAEALTQDHSLIADQLRGGYISDEEARSSRQRNVITRSLGVEPSVKPDLYGPISLRGGTALVLCSDGLHGVLEDAEIGSVVADASANEATKRLVDLANKRGGPDNVTVVAVRVPTSPDDTIYLRPRRGGLLRALVVAAGIAGVAATGLAIGAACSNRTADDIPGLWTDSAPAHLSAGTQETAQAGGAS
jgi:protein phosphatase